MCAVYYETRVSGSMRCRCNTCAFNVHVRTLCEGVHACVVCTVYYEAPCVADARHVLPMYMCVRYAKEYMLALCVQCTCITRCVSGSMRCRCNTYVLSMYISHAKEYMLALCVQCITRCVSGSELHALPKQYVCKKIAFSPLALNFLFLVVTDTFVMFFFVLGST